MCRGPSTFYQLLRGRCLAVSVVHPWQVRYRSLEKHGEIRVQSAYQRAKLSVKGPERPTGSDPPVPKHGRSTKCQVRMRILFLKGVASRVSRTWAQSRH